MNPAIEISFLYFCLTSKTLTVDNCEIHPSFTTVSIPLFCLLKLFPDVDDCFSLCSFAWWWTKIDLHFCCFHRVIKLSTLKGKITLNRHLHNKLSPCSQKSSIVLSKFGAGGSRGEEPFNLPMICSKTLFYLQDHILEVEMA